MSAAQVLRGLVGGAIFALLAASTVANESCRVAFDMGSSGIRAGASGSTTTTRADIDYLTPLWDGRGLAATLPVTIAALRELPEKAGFAADCRRVGGGFSAWRLALQSERPALAAQLASQLAEIRAASGVAVLVMPQMQEGAYGYFGARQLLGDQLTTSHVLDIGGGSLQIAGDKTSFAATLGQKVWHRHLCQEIRNSESTPCALQPLTGDELAIARSLLVDQLNGVAAALPEPVTMTAISRPVSRGVLPAVLRLAGDMAESKGFRRQALSQAIDRLARLTPQESAGLVGGTPSHVAYLLSDMLLVEGLLQATNSDYLAVAELDLTNLPGLLGDDRAFAWEAHYGCYLERLRTLGLDAYASDWASCP